MIRLRATSFALQIDRLLDARLTENVVTTPDFHGEPEAAEKVAQAIKLELASEAPLSTRRSTFSVVMQTFYANRDPV